jgi:hypothetical protein
MGGKKFMTDYQYDMVAGKFTAVIQALRDLRATFASLDEKNCAKCVAKDMTRYETWASAFNACRFDEQRP